MCGTSRIHDFSSNPEEKKNCKFVFGGWEKIWVYMTYGWTTELLFSGCGRAPSNQSRKGDEFVGGLAQGYGVLAPPHLPFHNEGTIQIRRSTRGAQHPTSSCLQSVGKLLTCIFKLPPIPSCLSYHVS